MQSVSRGKGNAQGSTSGGNQNAGGLRLAWGSEVSANVSIWIDLENCSPPSKKNVCKLSCGIINAIKELGYLGRVSIFAYGSITEFGEDQIIALQRSGVTFVHVQQTGQNTADKRMIADFMTWSFDNPIPSNLLIISSDTDFWPSMRTLKNNGHNVMMACRSNTYAERPPVDTVLSWENLVEGRASPAQIVLIDN